ncbi:MAG: hypothetical protein K9I26_06085 [Flavobacterium sp.]|nr:hypothetical protein [Flavobacterium sp.]
MKQTVIVVIPIHNEHPSIEELQSFKQCFKILSNHSIEVVAPKGLNLNEYENVVSQFSKTFIDPYWQSSIENYNKLKISKFFYDIFKNYDYILTYELDAFVFNDELEYWCNKNYDYIGAPWFDGWDKPLSNKIIGVGNSGFSLRKISTCLKMLNRIEKIKTIRNNYPFHKHISFYWIIRMIKPIFKIKNTKRLDSLLTNISINEDNYWATFISETFTDFKIAPENEALKFSFEVNPSYLFNLNHKKLPFGCHAYLKYEPEFWKNHIFFFNN